jgi:hypothetical protein
MFGSIPRVGDSPNPLSREFSDHYKFLPWQEIAMLVISTLSILLLATAYYLWRHSGEQPEIRGPRGEILRLGIQIICGDCCGDSHWPVKTYLDQFGRCVQCGGRAYVLASVCARHNNRMVGYPPKYEEPTGDVRRQVFGSQARLHAVRIHKASA